MKNQKGITLIALVITIIVLLILAGVSIAMLTGENGILTKASDAREKRAVADVDEALKLGLDEILANKMDPTYTEGTLNTITAENVKSAMEDNNSKIKGEDYSITTTSDSDVKVTFTYKEDKKYDWTVDSETGSITGPTLQVTD